MKSIVISLLTATFIMAGECTYKVKDIDVTWEAYKTPAKIGVDGTFEAIKLSALPDKSPEALLEGARISIDTQSVNSKNSSRDAKLVKFFFNVQGVKTITAEVKRVDKERADVEITINDVTKIVPMKVEFDEDAIEAEGYIDLADFDMLPSLESITKACFDLHKGKTWQDVKIGFDIKTSEKCK
ncbi:YceI family protein [Hydrogenimonas sp.]|uniref:YceI family protein n=1 Tax=Hydrogenimonas sp. TaxID=2231112 RepID=UPI0026057E72|nr:YceI family protein [Hydrogenimonas sp.]